VSIQYDDTSDEIGDCFFTFSFDVLDFEDESNAKEFLGILYAVEKQLAETYRLRKVLNN
jgi:hypothetical protein